MSLCQEEGPDEDRTQGLKAAPSLAFYLLSSVHFCFFISQVGGCVLGEGGWEIYCKRLVW